MPTQIKYFIITAILSFSFVTYSQTEEVEQNSLAKDSIENYLIQASEAINTARHERALDNITLAKELALKNQDKSYRAKTNRILAELYLELGDLKSAQEEITKAIEMQLEQNDEVALASSYTVCGSINTKQENFELAKKHLEKAFSLIEKNNLETLEGPLKINLGLLALSMNQPEQAIKHFNSGLPKIDFLEQPYYKAKLYTNKARAQMSLNQLDEAIATNDLAMQIGKEMDYFEIRSESYELYSEIYEKKGEFKTSLLNLKSHQQFKDSLFNIDKEIIAQDARAKLNVDDQKVKIDELTEENEQQQKSLKLGRLTTILSIALITILSLLTLSLYKNNNLRARANELLQNKNTELILAKENAERASEAKVQFLSTITHELRTPLYAVTGLTHLLLEESPTPNQKEHLNSLKFSGEYLLSLINNILDLNKLEANKVEIENTSFNLQKRINDVLIALGKSAKDRNNKLHYEFDKSIPPKLKGDPLKISQILINLIGNSIKFTQNGDIWIRVKMINHIENKVFLNFEIKDNGVGISDKKQLSIFENFTQGSVQINRKFGGTGLGLSIVKNLLSLMDSEIKLESELGQGSRFHFDLKFDVFEDLSANYHEEAKKIDYSLMIDKRVLVVEDNKINQLITRKILEKNKMICDVADNGDIAVNKTKNSEFDLILMDIHMPGISGIEATKQIREFNTEIPIVALTAVTLDDNLDEFYNNGFNDIIPKPYKTEEFFTKLHKALSKKQTTS
ncbi:tetratricopeptide repeat-containing hybrid sensor histidine kinase/response regulator [Aquimarina sp. 2201CG14-23]|uniref:tetratricopeptide repeat-containing hybrid sensor histidine kinase/response regulator n=1 Tax=Aquimarina mycalae TaxID=3040073 RepID=UPI0024782877|nr:response regulator [Aquimarina sp. 2201CG14-23]MDH7444605.1 response regulator [Aquimarina sp. 2201CG14-23]